VAPDVSHPSDDQLQGYCEHLRSDSDPVSSFYFKHETIKSYFSEAACVISTSLFTKVKRTILLDLRLRKLPFHWPGRGWQ
jgi:hypothetical protein